MTVRTDLYHPIPQSAGLDAEANESAPDEVAFDGDNTPLRVSVKQLIAFNGIRCSEPMVFFVVFPFMSEMLLEYGIAKDARSTGYSAGVLEAALAVTNTVGILFWIRVADTRGRRTAMIPTTAAFALAGAMFGLPRSYLWLLVVRMLAGLLNGQSAIAKTYLAEITTKETEAFAFSLMSMAWQMGWCFSAVIGGFLAHPEKSFPSLSGITILQNHPYLLPPVIVAIPAVLSSVLAYFALAETLSSATLPSKPSSAGNSQQTAASFALWAAVRGWTPKMWKASSIFTTLCLMNVFFQASLPLWLFAPVAAGGLAVSTSGIAIWYAVRAVLIILVEVPIYPRFHKRFGTATMLRGQAGLYLVVYCMHPLISTVRRWIGAEGLDWCSLTLLALLMCLEVAGQTMFISGDLLCTNAAPVKSGQSVFNAIIEAQAKVAYVIASWSASWLFAYSAESQWLNGYLIWACVWLFCAWAFYQIYHFEEGEGWRSAVQSEPPTPLPPLTPGSASMRVLA